MMNIMEELELTKCMAVMAMTTSLAAQTPIFCMVMAVMIL